MIRTERRPVASEQLLVLWTLLLEGYVPVAHIVVDLDESEAPTANASADAASAHRPRPRTQLACKEAA